MRILPLLSFLILVLVLAAMLLAQGGNHPAAQRRERMPTLAVTALDNGAVWKADALSGNVTLINFFASWCAPCEAEMPELMALKKQFPQLRMQGIAWNDQPAALQRFLTRSGDPFHRVWLDKKGEATMALGIRGIPETLLVDGKGMIRLRIAGPLTSDMREGDLAALLKQLLAEATHEK